MQNHWTLFTDQDVYNSNSGESFIVLTLVTEHGKQFESWMEDEGQLQLREVFTWTWLKY